MQRNQRNQRIQTTATHLRRIYQSGKAVAMRVGAIKRNHANALAKIGKAVGNSWDEAVSLARSMAYTPPLAELATAGNRIGLPPARHATPAHYSRADGNGGDDWIEPVRTAMSGRAARSASARFAKRLGLILLAALCVGWMLGVSK
jgi:hypothetical protein